MKKIFLILALITLICGSSALFAQAGGTKTLTLEKVCESLAARPNTTGDFTQTKTLQTNGRKLKSSGKFIFSTEGIVWRTEKPFPSSLILTKDTMTMISANGTKSVMDGKDNQIFANISETLSSVFSGNAEQLKKNFKCDFSEADANGWKLVLTPKDSTIASVMSTLTLSGEYNKKTDEAALSALLMTEASDNTILYEFTNQNYSKDLSQDEKKYFAAE